MPIAVTETTADRISDLIVQLFVNEMAKLAEFGAPRNSRIELKRSVSVSDQLSSSQIPTKGEFGVMIVPGEVGTHFVLSP